MTSLISIREAAKNGIKNLRLDQWVNEHYHIEIQILDQADTIGPWLKIWSSPGTEPQKILVTMMGDLDAKIWRSYSEPKTEDAIENNK